MRKTKIICTIGPASADERVLTQMCLAGMNVARLNFSHGTHEEHKEKIDLIKRVRENLDMPIPIMLDTKGPEYRIKTFKEGSVEIADGAEFTFTTREVEGDETCVSVSFERLIQDLCIGDRILVNNGLVVFEVKELTATDAICTTIVGGTLSNRKSMSFPNKVMSGPYLSEQDKADILFGIRNDVDFVAASFVSTKADVSSLRQFLNPDPDHKGGKLMLVVIQDHQLDTVRSVVKSVMGSLDRPDTGIEFTIPIFDVEGVPVK